MHTTTPPQIQAFKHLSNFVDAHAALRTLLIVYYAGHGYRSARDRDHIALSGKAFIELEDKFANSIEWHEVERTLVSINSDVLVIFDCCQAGLLCSSAREGSVTDGRIFQYLGACESQQQTRSAGEHSFTSAVTWALKELIGETSFPVTKLVKKIESHAGFPHGKQRPVLFSGRFDPASANICLGCMSPQL